MNEVKVTVRRAMDDDGSPCADGKTCAAVLEVDGMPGRFVVVKQITDPALVAALAPYVAEGEVVGWTPPGLITEV